MELKAKFQVKQVDLYLHLVKYLYLCQTIRNMRAELQEIRDAQRASWDKFSPGWKKWDKYSMEFLSPHGNAIIEALKPQGNDVILDVASGTGEPGLTIAELIPKGKVTVTDLSDGMLKIASEKAMEKNLANVITQQADVSQLPFDDNIFDVVSCRLGFMFFPDMQMAADEMVRVLKPGGRLATTVWGDPENNFWVTSIVQNINKHIEMPHPQPGAPGMFRCAQPGLIGGLFANAGLIGIAEEEIHGKINCESPREYWDFMTSIAAPFVKAMSGADEETVIKIREGVIDSINLKYPGNQPLETFGRITYGVKA